MVSGKMVAIWKKKKPVKLALYFIPYKIINSKCVRYLSAKHKTIQVLEKNE